MCGSSSVFQHRARAPSAGAAVRSALSRPITASSHHFGRLSSGDGDRRLSDAGARGTNESGGIVIPDTRDMRTVGGAGDVSHSAIAQTTAAAQAQRARPGEPRPRARRATTTRPNKDRLRALASTHRVQEVLERRASQSPINKTLIFPATFMVRYLDQGSSAIVLPVRMSRLVVPIENTRGSAEPRPQAPARCAKRHAWAAICGRRPANSPARALEALPSLSRFLMPCAIPKRRNRLNAKYQSRF